MQNSEENTQDSQNIDDTDGTSYFSSGRTKRINLMSNHPKYYYLMHSTRKRKTFSPRRRVKVRDVATDARDDVDSKRSSMESDSDQLPKESPKTQPHKTPRH